uniref:Uncharacterized protein n=1 Tax=Bactrocera dorsalis TaxID=27457 RepID=A0A034VLT0_BACDO
MFGLKMCVTTNEGYKHNNNAIYIKHRVPKHVAAEKLHKTNNNNRRGKQISEINCENSHKFNKINTSNNNYNNKCQCKIVAEINNSDNNKSASWSVGCDSKVHCKCNGYNNNKTYQHNSCGSDLAFTGDKCYACNGGMLAAFSA